MIINLVVTAAGNVHVSVSRPLPWIDVDGNLHRNTIKAYNLVSNASFMRLLRMPRLDIRRYEAEEFTSLTIRTK